MQLVSSSWPRLRKGLSIFGLVPWLFDFGLAHLCYIGEEPLRSESHRGVIVVALALQRLLKSPAAKLGKDVKKVGAKAGIQVMDQRSWYRSLGVPCHLIVMRRSVHPHSRLSFSWVPEEAAALSASKKDQPPQRPHRLNNAYLPQGIDPMGQKLT